MSAAEDHAAVYARQYMEAIARAFEATILDNGDPLIVVDRITPTAVRKLAGDLSDVLSNNARLRSLESTASYGETHVQSVAFGSINDWDATVKVGRLYSERVVLWDILGLRCVEIAKQFQQERYAVLRVPPNLAEELALIAANVLKLWPLAHDGALAVLPHPLAWSDAAVEANNRARRGYSGVFYGTAFGVYLATTLAVTRELHLHPYTVADFDLPIPDGSTLEAALSRDNRMLQRTYTSLIEDVKFGYLREVTVAQFHKLLSAHNDVAEELQTLLGSLGGKTQQQWMRRMDYVRRSLAAAVEKQNARLSSKDVLAVGKGLAELAAEFVPLRGTFAVLAAVADAAEPFVPDEPTLAAPNVVAFFSHAKWVSENFKVAIPGTWDTAPNSG